VLSFLEVEQYKHFTHIMETKVVTHKRKSFQQRLCVWKIFSLQRLCSWEKFCSKSKYVSSIIFSDEVFKFQPTRVRWGQASFSRTFLEATSSSPSICSQVILPKRSFFKEVRTLLQTQV